MCERWAFALLFIGSFTYTMAALARRWMNLGRGLGPDRQPNAARRAHARPMTTREMRRRGW